MHESRAVLTFCSCDLQYLSHAAIQGLRERVEHEVVGEITAEARRQLAVHGASSLSLRAVARELGMVSSGIYRYFASRDELLTALIIEAYDSLGQQAEEAARRSAGDSPADRWCAVARAVRAWAIANPHEYALVYGTPVPGYEAPEDTVDPASRSALAMIGIAVDAHRTGHVVTARRCADRRSPPALHDDVAAARGPAKASNYPSRSWPACSSDGPSCSA